jgi:hypothetical protein
MQEKELNRAIIRVVSSIDISGRAAADEIKVDLQTEEKRFFWRTASSAILRYFMAVGLLVALLAPLPASADDDKDLNHRHEDNDKGIRAEIAALKAQVTALQDQVKSLQSSNATLQEQLAAVQSNHALLLGPFVNVDPNPEIRVIGPNIIFSGANIHIVSGSGATNDNGSPTGLGNLIIGYDEAPSFGLPLNPSERGGSHNLVIGPGNRFTAYGGLVAGSENTISNAGTSVSGGTGNTASGFFSSVSGGVENTASGVFTSVLGGIGNTAVGFPPRAGSSVVGGELNTVGGRASVVIGGSGVIDSNDNSIAPQPPFP